MTEQVDRDEHTREQVHVGASEADDARNRIFGAGIVDDPYPSFHRLREQCPVHAGTIASQFPGMEQAQGMVPEGTQAFATYDHDHGVEVLRRAHTFSSKHFYATLADSIGDSVISMDEPDHRRMRTLLQPAFSRREMDRWSTEIIEPVVDEHLDRIAAWGQADLYAEVASKVPVHTIAAALGLPVEDRHQFFEWAIAMTSTAHSPQDRQAASQAVARYIEPIVAARRTAPGDDLISMLVTARVPAEERAEGVDDRPLSDAEVATFVRLLIIAGAGTTYRAYGTLMYHLLTNPDQLAEVRADRSLVLAAVEESLRIDQPLAYIGRVAIGSCELAGQHLPAGSLVEVSVGAANHDPALWADPERFDIHRERVDRHLSFGFGIHRCLGIHLARAELAVLLNRTLDRLANLHLDPEATGIHMTGLGFRMVTKLPVRFDPAS